MSRIVDFEEYFENAQSESPPTVKSTPGDAPNHGTKAVEASFQTEKFGPDFTPGSPEVKEAYIKNRATYSPFNYINKKVYPDYTKGDYVPGEECVKESKLHKEVIKSMAKDLWDSYRVATERYEKHLDIFKKMSEFERDNPNGEQKITIATVSKGPPITKAQCIERAKQTFYEKRSV